MRDIREKKKIGELLVKAGVISEMQLSSALGEQNRWGGKLCSIVMKRGFAGEENIALALEQQLGKRCIVLRKKQIPAEVLRRVEPEIARKYHIIPFGGDDKSLDIAVSDPDDLRTMDELSFILGVRIRPFLALESGIKEGLERFYRDEKDDPPVRIAFDRPYTPPPELAEERKRTDQRQIAADLRVEVLTRLLIEKGVITETELRERMRL